MELKRWLNRIVTFCVVTFYSLSCSVNILENFSDKTTNDAIYVAALELLNKESYTAAIEKINTITGDDASSRKVISLKASAYAGRCGLKFLDFVTALKDMGSNRLLPTLLSTYKNGTTAKIDDCITAETLLISIGSKTERTTDENMFLVAVAFAKVGTILSFYADSDGDGNGDSGFDPCISNPSRTTGSMRDSDAAQLGTGITIGIDNISAITAVVSVGNASLDSINTTCASLPASYNFCSVTDATTMETGSSGDYLKGVKSLVKESTSVGLGTNCTGGIGTCFCL